MGFFSWNCKACGHPMLSSYVTDEHNEWMSDVVVLAEDGSVLKGEYDGYGRVGEHEYDYDEPEAYHKACWELEGKPTEFKEASVSARDQGYFFGPDVHSFSEPKNLEDLRQIKIAGDMAQQQCCDSWKMAHLDYLLSIAHKALHGEDVEENTKTIDEYIAQREKKEKEQEELRKQREENAL